MIVTQCQTQRTESAQPEEIPTIEVDMFYEFRPQNEKDHDALIAFAYKLRESVKTTVDNVLGDIHDRPETQQKVTGATIMIEALKADGLMSEDIDKAKAASEAIRRHIDPMSSPILIEDMRRE